MGRTMIHVSLSVSGYLRGPDRDLKGLFGLPNGDVLSPAEARAYLKVQESRGVELIAAEKCEGFDPKNGCPGHSVEDPAEPGAVAHV